MQTTLLQHAQKLCLCIFSAAPYGLLLSDSILSSRRRARMRHRARVHARAPCRVDLFLPPAPRLGPPPCCGLSFFPGLFRLLCPPISSITNKQPIFSQLFKGQKSLAAQRKNAFFFPKKAFCCLFRFHRLSSAYCPLYTKNSHRAICNHRYTVDRSACASVTACRHTAPAILCVVLLRSV